MIEKIAATPYNMPESIKWLLRYIADSPGKNAGISNIISSPYELNEGIERRFVLTAIGDIMGMRGHRLVMQSALKEFISDSDYLIGNFEGTITGKKSAIWPISFEERHDAAITEELSGLFPPDRTYLCVSNNHACDFGAEDFFRSIGMLKSSGFNVFGWRDKPYCDINDNLRVISGTIWSNRKCDYIATFEMAENCVKHGAFNLLYPHMGYEFERYPRQEIVRLARKGISKFDAIVSHHPHCPQPVTTEETKSGPRLLAYSLGNFCCGSTKKIFRYGIVIKIELGQDCAGRWLIGRVEWRHVECAIMKDGRFTAKLMA